MLEWVAHFLLHRIFPTQGWILCLLLWQAESWLRSTWKVVPVITLLNSPVCLLQKLDESWRMTSKPSQVASPNYRYQPQTVSLLEYINMASGIQYVKRLTEHRTWMLMLFLSCFFFFFKQLFHLCLTYLNILSQLPSVFKKHPTKILWKERFAFWVHQFTQFLSIT